MILTVENGGFCYESGKTVLKNMSFDVHGGEILCVLGPNGAGKTTLLRCMLGLLPWSTGKSCLDGRDIRSLPAGDFWKKVAYVPQKQGTVSSQTVKEAVLLGRAGFLNPFRTPGREDRAAAEQALERLGMSHLADRRCDALSGGEYRMVLLARALAGQPELLVLDEPESNLDFKNQLLLLETLKGLADEGMAVLFNTHYPAHALRYAHRALLLKKGGGGSFGPTEDILTEERLTEAFGVETHVITAEHGGRVLKDVIAVK